MARQEQGNGTFTDVDRRTPQEFPLCGRCRRRSLEWAATGDEEEYLICPNPTCGTVFKEAGALWEGPDQDHQLGYIYRPTEMVVAIC